MGWREKEAAKLANKKVLMVGAGGIGCELLKNIVLCGFKDIHVIDLDTIDVSNLNRQFLFRREHVGKSKAEVSTAAGLRLSPDVKITFDHDSIFSEKFNYEFFKEFTLVLNALDNRNARNHVNRMCMSTRVPLIDGGSAGYFGQVTPLIRGRTECYECEPKQENTKSFPGCTIRNTPSEHIHCTVWAKHVFNQLFGEMDIDDDVSPDMDDEEAKENKGEDAPATNGAEKKADGDQNGEEAAADQKPGNTRAMAEACGYDAEIIFNKLFVDDIRYLLRMANLWKERRPPVPQPFGTLPTDNPSSSTTSATHIDPLQAVWTPAENGDEFKRAVEALRKRKAITDDGILTWDKDDDDAMRFVASCANIRAVIFGIPPKSLFEIKSMAGNIIPAIATTNAIVAGAMTVEALKVMKGDFDALRYSVIFDKPTIRGKILHDDAPLKPKPDCYTCSIKREVAIRVNVEEMTVKTLRDLVLIGALGVEEPDVFEATANKGIISSEEGELDGLLDDALAAHGLSSGGRLNVDDFATDAQLRLVILQAASFGPEQFEIISDEKPEAHGAENGAHAELEEAPVSMETDGVISPDQRKRKTLEPTDLPIKKARIADS